ncbi:nickel transporter [[Pantoea] beijingensis]|uniref:Nickel/cobalt efflux system n=1 Tax=[Pantoea] beijingensis TaxID=1324864 RepID=A0A443IFV8_9GAMM|nr:nickel/cobalt transporter [[Pantoea] beijingensis]RWR02974.1 nickel transporter [[Pantoea] beijingensis]
MPVNALITKRSPLRRHALMLLLLLLLAGGGVILLWLLWPQLLLQSVIWQKTLNQQMTALLVQVEVNPHRAGLVLLGFSLVYGVLHAVGPGHGKVVIATFLATHPTRLKTSLKLTLAAAVVQGATAIMLVSVMLVIFRLSSRQLHLSSYWLEKGSYLLVVGLGLWLSWRALKGLRNTLRLPVAPTVLRIYHIGHHHHARCGCGHRHVPDAHVLSTAISWKTKALVVLSMGMRPCSGAIMLLLFSKVIGVYVWGVLSAVVMAFGTAFTVSVMAMLVQSFRALAIRLSQRGQAPWLWQRVALQSLALLGGVLLVLAGSLLWFGTRLALSNGIRPF